MDDALSVRGAERERDLSGDADQPADRERPLFAQERRQVGSLEQLHGHEHDLAIVLDELEHLDDVGIAYRARRHRLAPKALQDVLVLGEVRVQHLDGDPLFVELRLVDGAHPAFGELLPHVIAAVEGPAHQGITGHGRQ